MTAPGAKGHPSGQGGRGAAARPPLPSPLPPVPPGACGPRGRRPSAPPGAYGTPPPRRDTDAPGGMQLDPHAARPRAPHRLLSRGS